MSKRNVKFTPRLTPSEAYERFLPLAYKMAERFRHKYPRVGIDDLRDEAVSVLGQLCAQWDTPGTYYYDGRVSPSTWMWHNLYWFLHSFCQRNQPKYRTMTDITPDEDNPPEFPSRSGWLDGLLRELGDDAKVIVRTIVEAPAEIAPDRPAWFRGRNAWHRVWQYMSGQGWDVERISRAWREVEVAL